MLLGEIFSRVKLTLILIVIACAVSAFSKRVKKSKVMHGPSGMSFKDSTNCSEFAKFARFNPFSILRQKWFVFYYWAPLVKLTTFVFTYPSANHTKHLKRLFEGNVVLPVMWSARQILMEDDRKIIKLLVERSDRGEYWSYPVGRVEEGRKITPRDVRLKQTGDNRILGLMDCVDQTLLVMARLNEVPRKDKLHEEASRLGYRGRKGKSYLYQGHEWGPIPEADEESFWTYDKREKRKTKDTSTEDKSSEDSNEEVGSQPTNKPENPKKKKCKAKKSKAVSPVDNFDDEMCVKVEPQLWNDPIPSPPTPDKLLITMEELNNLDDILDKNNTLTIETTDESPSNQQENKLDKESENKLDKESENTQVSDKLDNDNDVQEREMEITLKEPENLELHRENQEPEKENCVTCYKSQVSYISTGYSYIPESTRSTANLKNNEEVPRTEVPHPNVPRTEVPRAEVPHPEVPRTEIPVAEVPRPEISRAKISSAKVPVRPPAPQEGLTNSSELIILSPNTIDDLKI